jgi:hypothetical protein
LSRNGRGEEAIQLLQAIEMTWLYQKTSVALAEYSYAAFHSSLETIGGAFKAQPLLVIAECSRPDATDRKDLRRAP